jgi:hypothetical protein
VFLLFPYARLVTFARAIVVAINQASPGGSQRISRMAQVTNPDPTHRLVDRRWRQKDSRLGFGGVAKDLVRIEGSKEFGKDRLGDIGGCPWGSQSSLGLEAGV